MDTDTLVSGSDVFQTEFTDTKYQALMRAVLDGTATIDVMGLGYVGWPLAKAFKQAGFRTYGLDKDPATVAARKEDTGSGVYVWLANEFNADSDIVIICVPTPLTDGIYGSPDSSLVHKAARAAGVHLDNDRMRMLVIESTIGPGTTEEIATKAGKNWLIVHSPERIDPGNAKSYHATCPKLVGGITKEGGQLAACLYKFICSDVFVCRDALHAELAKLWENSFRLLNISAVNELSQACRAFGADVHVVLDAASTKPFGYMPFRPGPGAGGHCIPIDPVYLHDRALAAGFSMPLLLRAVQINQQRASVLATHIWERARKHWKETSFNERTLLLVGEAYKPNIEDKRCSPTLILEEILKPLFAKVRVYDPYTGRADAGYDDQHDICVKMVDHKNLLLPKATLTIDATRETY